MKIKQKIEQIMTRIDRGYEVARPEELGKELLATVTASAATWAVLKYGTNLSLGKRIAAYSLVGLATYGVVLARAYRRGNGSWGPPVEPSRAKPTAPNPWVPPPCPPRNRRVLRQEYPQTEHSAFQRKVLAGMAWGPGQSKTSTLEEITEAFGAYKAGLYMQDWQASSWYGLDMLRDSIERRILDAEFHNYLKGIKP